MKVFRYLSIAMISAGLFVSCTESEELNPISVDSDFEFSTKVVKLSDEYDNSSILVKFDSVPGSEELSAIMVRGVANAERLFPATAGNEELEARFGLDRWYELTVSEGYSVDQLLPDVAKIGAVSVVEYNSIAKADSDGKIYSAGYETKAGDVAFNDPLLAKQWHYINTGAAAVSKNAVAGADIDVESVWKGLTCGDPSIIVAVVDEGVCYTHPDLAANMWTNSGEIPGNGIDDDGNGYIDDIHGYNFVDGGDISWVKDGDSGHGTHCAGTIAAVNNNGIGVSGVAGGSGNNDGCRIMSCQIFSGKYGGSASHTSKAIKYAADNGASIISCSFGYTSAFSSDNSYLKSVGSAEIDAIHYFEAHKNNNPVLKDGNIAIFSSGNDSHNYAHYPGAFYDIISVSAFGPDFLPAYYTNYGPGCNISAPGGEAFHVINDWSSFVLSTTPDNIAQLFTAGENKKTGNLYGYMQGTSMACPHVSGVVALALSYAKKLGKTYTVSEFKNLILSSVNDMDVRISKTSSKSYAYGRSALDLIPYYHKMGTGAIDAWQLMMHIEGLESCLVKTGETQWVDLSEYFGTASISLTYLSVEVPQSTVDALGLEKVTAEKYSGTNGDPILSDNSYAYEQFGRLYLHPTKTGSGKIIVKAVGGGDHLGGGDNAPGGMEIRQEISIVSRVAVADNGGWL